MLDADNTKRDAPYLWRERETARNFSSQLEMRGKRDGRKRKEKKKGVKGKQQLEEELEVEVVEATSPTYLPSFLNLKF